MIFTDLLRTNALRGGFACKDTAMGVSVNPAKPEETDVVCFELNFF